MQPLAPHVRAALKAEYPGLTDAVIDEVEALLAYRTTLDPERAPERVRDAQSRRESLIAEHMPRYAEVLRRVRSDGLRPDWPSVRGMPGAPRDPSAPARPATPRQDPKGQSAR